MKYSRRRFLHSNRLREPKSGYTINIGHLASVGESSASIRERVCRARNLQAQRFSGPVPSELLESAEEEAPHPALSKEEIQRPKRSRSLFCNAPMGSREIRAYCAPSKPVKGLLRTAIQQLGLSARAYDRLLKVARTIADLGGARDIQVAHVAAAIPYRSLDRKFWVVSTQWCSWRIL